MASPEPVAFRQVGFLNDIWDLTECQTCFALVSSESEDEHTAFHQGITIGEFYARRRAQNS